MNVINSILTAEDQALLLDWCASIRAAYAEVTKPLVEGDPRRAEMEARYGNISQFSAEECGELYYLHGFSVPPIVWPLAVPAWVVDTHVLRGAYPEIQVQLVGQAWETANGFSARIEQSFHVSIEDNDEGSRDEIKTGGPLVRVQDLDLDLELDLDCYDAISLATAIEDAATELRRYESVNV